jgi:hypothetical protein
MNEPSKQRIWSAIRLAVVTALVVLAWRFAVSCVNEGGPDWWQSARRLAARMVGQSEHAPNGELTASE